MTKKPLNLDRSERAALIMTPHLKGGIVLGAVVWLLVIPLVSLQSATYLIGNRNPPGGLPKMSLKNDTIPESTRPAFSPQFSALLYAMKTQSHPADSLLKTGESPADSLKKSLSEDSLNQAQRDSVLRARDDLDTVVVYTARDSIVYELKARAIFLTGDAKVLYQDLKLEAPEVEIATEENRLSAFSQKDTNGYVIIPAKFSDAGGNYEADRLSYNFKSRRGKINEVYTQIEQAYYRGEQIKRQETGELFIKGGYYTTCNEDHWHYWFYCSEMKLVPNERVFARPVVLYVEGVPVFVLPYAFFPTQRSGGRASGIIVPRYGFDAIRGFFLAQGGYYWAIDDYTDVKMEADYGTRGSWRIGSAFNYSKRYDFSGSISGEFQRLFINEEGDPDFQIQQSWNLRINHAQEFNPSTRLNANMNFSSQGVFGITTINPNNLFNQQATSTARLDHTLGDNEGSLSLGYLRTQWLERQDVTNQFNFAFAKTRFFPFRDKRSDGMGLLEQIGIDPTLNIDASTRDAEGIENRTVNAVGGFGFNLQLRPSTAVQMNFAQSIRVNSAYSFDIETLDRTGMLISAPVTFGFNLPNYNLNLSAGLGLNHTLTDRVNERRFNPLDSTIDTRVIRGPAGFTTYTVSVAAQTRLYGLLFTPLLSDLIGLKALRHTLVPNVSYTYNPDFTAPRFGYFGSVIDRNGQDIRYNRFEGALLGGVPGESQSLGVTLNNTFEAKVKSLDTTKSIDDPARTEANVQFLNAFINGGYNFAAPDFKFQPIGISASSNTLAPLFVLNGAALFDYYATDTLGRRIPRSQFSQTGELLRFVNAQLGFTFTVRGESQPRSATTADSLQQALPNQPGIQSMTNQWVDQTDFGRNFGRNVDFDIPWDLSLNGTLNADRSNPALPTSLNAQINLNGGVSITRNWKLTASAGYTFREKQFLAPVIRINRDFHCWTMSLQWTPIGQFRSYFFQINLKAPELQDIRFEKTDRPVSTF